MDRASGYSLLSRLRPLLNARENALDSSKQRVIVDVPHGVQDVNTADLKFQRAS